MKKRVMFASLLFTLLLGAKEYDIVTGLVIDEGIDDIKENCTVCHPGRFIVVNGGGREFWKHKINVMQKGFGLWELDSPTKEKIIRYLSKNYSQKVNVDIDK